MYVLSIETSVNVDFEQIYVEVTTHKSRFLKAVSGGQLMLLIIYILELGLFQYV